MQKGEETSYSANSCSSDRIQWNGLILTRRGLYGSCGSRDSRFTVWPLGSCDTGDQTIPQNKIWGCFYFHFSVFAVGCYDIFQSPHLILSAFFNVRWTRGQSDEGLALIVVAFPVFCGDKLTVIIKPSFVFHASMTRVCIAFVMASKSVVFLCYSTKL